MSSVARSWCEPRTTIHAEAKVISVPHIRPQAEISFTVECERILDEVRVELHLVALAVTISGRSGFRL